MANKKIAEIFLEIAELLEIKGTAFKPKAYRKVALVLGRLKEDVSSIYKKVGIGGLEQIAGVGENIAKKIEEYLKKGGIKYYEELKQETAIRQTVTHYFKSKGLDLDEIKKSAKKKKIIYSRHVRPAKQLLELAGSVSNAKRAIDKVAGWAKSRNLDYAIETVFKKWLELDKLKPKEIVKKPFYDGDPMVWSQTKKKWFVIVDGGEWKEYADDLDKIEWKIAKK